MNSDKIVTTWIFIMTITFIYIYKYNIVLDHDVNHEPHHVLDLLRMQITRLTHTRLNIIHNF